MTPPNPPPPSYTAKSDNPRQSIPFDNTLRTARTPSEIAKAREEIKKIKTVRGYSLAVGPLANRLTVGRSTDPTVRLFAALVRERDKIIAEQNDVEQTLRQAQDNLQILKELEIILQKTQTVIAAQQTLVTKVKTFSKDLEQYKTRVDSEIFLNLDEAKSAIHTADLAAKTLDDEQLHRRIRLRLEEPSIPTSKPSFRLSHANSVPIGRRIVPTLTTAVVRNLSAVEVERRGNSKCHACGGIGHWYFDHTDYRCQTCDKTAPGHGSGSDWCPNWKSPRGTRDDPIDDDYDDYLGDEAEHNLNT